ncbi:MAG: hypothetical protein K2Q20_05545, partial [Phycisphaerales bacterium]|nr:hypothetical protein [Phycisphaerales bacterium]
GTTIAQTTPVAFSGQFGQGSIVLSRTGAAGGTSALTNAATAVFLDEFRVTSGRGASASVSYAQSLALGTATAGARLTLSGSASSEGALSYARDASGNNYLFIAGYDAASGTAAVVGTTSTATPRTVGRIDLSGNQIYTGFTDAYSANNIRSVASPDGVNFITAGANTGFRSGTVGASNSTITTAAFGGATPTNNRVVNYYNGNAFASASSGTFQGVSALTSTTTTLLNGFPTATGPSNYDFVFVNDSTIYVADDRTTTAGGLQRWNLVSGTWTLAYTINVPNIAGTGTAGLRGLTASVVGDDLAFYAVSTDNRLIGISDLLSNTTAAGASSASLVGATFFSATSSSYAFRGVEIIPTPGAASLLALGGLIAARRRRSN